MAGAHEAKEATIPDHTWHSFFVVGLFNSENALTLFSLGFIKTKPLSWSLSAEIRHPPNSITVDIMNLLGFNLMFFALQDFKNSAIISSKAGRVGAPIITSSMFFRSLSQHLAHLRSPSER